MNETQNFRIAFNGFNREDVVRYLEYLNTRHETRIFQLKEEAQKLRKEVEQMRPAAEIQEEAQAFREKVAELEAENEEKQRVIADLEEKIQGLEHTLTQLRGIQSGVVPTPKAWADDELAAYRRAEQTERQAIRRSDALLSRANKILTDAAAEIDANGEEVNQTTDQVLEALGHLADALSRCRAAMLTNAATLRGVKLENQEK